MFEETERIYEKDDYGSFVEDQIEIINTEFLGIQEKMNKVNENLQRQIVLTNDELSIYRLLKNPDKYKRYLKKSDVSKRVSLWHKKIGDFKFSHKNKKLTFGINKVMQSFSHVKYQRGRKNPHLLSIQF